MTASYKPKTLSGAVAQGDTGIVQNMLQEGSDIHANNDEALRSAAAYGHSAIVTLLLDQGADVHANNDKALQWAASNGHRETVLILLGRGADLHAENDHAFRWAASNGRREVVALLLDHGANIHAEDDQALWLAAGHGHRETVSLLLDRGADVHAGNDLALLRATLNLERDTATLLLRYGADPQRAMGDNCSFAGELAKWMAQLRQQTVKRFRSRKPARSQCFTESDRLLHDSVLDACVTASFTTLIGAPLIASRAQADRQLFQDIWDALPMHWQDQHQNLYVQFAKEGGIHPICGPYTSTASRCSAAVDAGRLNR